MSDKQPLLVRRIKAAQAMRVALPESGPVPVVDEQIVTGEGFTLRLSDAGRREG